MSLRDWRLHGLLACFCLVQLGTWLVTHRTPDELEASWQGGPSASRVAAAHVLASRLPDRTREERLLPSPGELLAHPDPLLRSLAFSSDVCKLASPRPQLEAIAAAAREGRPWAYRDFILQCRKVGGRAVGSLGAMKRPELDAWLRSASGAPPSAEDAQRLTAALEPVLRWLEETP